MRKRDKARERHQLQHQWKKGRRDLRKYLSQPNEPNDQSEGNHRERDQGTARPRDRRATA